jgi:hypothetical protein
VFKLLQRVHLSLNFVKRFASRNGGRDTDKLQCHIAILFQLPRMVNLVTAACTQLSENLKRANLCFFHGSLPDGAIGIFSF